MLMLQTLVGFLRAAAKQFFLVQLNDSWYLISKILLIFTIGACPRGRIKFFLHEIKKIRGKVL